MCPTCGDELEDIGDRIRLANTKDPYGLHCPACGAASLSGDMQGMFD